MTDEKGVQSIERALDIIESVAEEQYGKHLTAIAEETGLHKSTAHRMILPPCSTVRLTSFSTLTAAFSLMRHAI